MPRSLLLAVLAAVLVTPPAAAQDIAIETHPTNVTAAGGWAVWSHHIGPAKAGRYVLMGSRDGGTPVRLNARPRLVPFDADAGLDERGRPVIAYSRCGVEPRGPDFVSNAPFYGEGKRCDIFVFDLTAQTERRVDSVSLRRGSEYLPSVSGSRIAFVRRLDRQAGIAGRLPHLMLGRTDRAKVTELAGGKRGLWIEDDGNAVGWPVEGGGPGPVRLDLLGTDLSLSWAFLPADESLARFRCVPDYDSIFDQPFVVDVLRVRPGQARPSLVDRGCTLSNRRTVSSTVAATAEGTVYLRWTVTPGRERLCVFSELIRAGAGASRAADTPPIAPEAVDGGALNGARYDGERWIIGRQALPTFDRTPRETPPPCTT